MHRPRRALVGILGLGSIIVCVGLLSARWLAAEEGGQDTTPNAEAHKQWMNDAADAQEDAREALAAKNATAVGSAAVKMEGFMARTESYWAAKKAMDVVKLAQTSRTQANDVARSAAAGRLAEASAAFQQLSDTCNACHELHPEKR